MELSKGKISCKCTECGVIFIGVRKHLARAKNNFCSRECFARFRNPLGAEKTMGNTGLKQRDYNKIHRWLSVNYGKAERCDKCNVLNAKKYEWALRKGYSYECKIENFMQLCCHCHRKYDERKEVNLKISLSLKKNSKLKGKYSHRARIVLNTEYGIFYETVNEAATLYQIKPTTLISMLKGVNKNKTKLIYA